MAIGFEMTDLSNLHALGEKVANQTASIDEITDFVSTLMPQAVMKVNSIFSPRQLAKQDRKTERLPIAKRQLSEYRTRLGTMLEYALSTQMDALIEKTFGKDLRITFAVAHQYPDFFVRDEHLAPSIRIEMKAVDADSDEQAARFEVLSSLILGDKDVVIVVGWEWVTDRLANGTAFEYPAIFSFVIVPAAELARERDQSVVLRGGRIETDQILVPSKSNPDELTRDKGNAGKILRLIHKSRKRDPFQLSQHIQRYLQFIGDVEKRATKRRTDADL